MSTAVSANPVLRLQHTIGNRAVQRLLRSRAIQPKLAISQSGDVYEQEADRVAEQVMRMPELAIQRACAPCATGEAPCPKCEAENERLVQRKAEPPSDAASVPDDFLRRLGAGRPLDPATRAFFEPRFGHDFSRVWVHTDTQAAESARAVNALAYAVGRDVVFGSAQYAPESREGRKLIAHELAHMLQQTRRNTGPSKPALQRKVSPDLSAIQNKLTKNVSKDDVRHVVAIFKGLSDEDLRDTVRALETRDEAYVERLLLNVSDEDAKAELATLRRIKNARVRKTVITTGGTTVTTEIVGSCAADQSRQIYQAASTAVSWLNKAVARMDSYIAAPGDARNKGVNDAVTIHFHSTSADVVRHVRERLARIRADIQSAPQFGVECHGSWDKLCDVAGAYVADPQRNVVVFCSSFFGNTASSQAETMVHEMAHAQVGGEFITDRGYEADRMLPRLSTEEALTNAESYGLLTEQLATGKIPATNPPRDTREDCPETWWRLLQKAIAIAQRWNRNAQVTFSTLMPSQVQTAWRTLLGGATRSDIDRAKKAYNRTAEKLKSSIDFECEPKGGGRCDTFATYWYATGDFHICPSWTAQAKEEDRVESLLAGLFGYIGDVDDSKRRSSYAALAREIQSGWATPTLGKILGTSKWNPGDINISVTPVEPKAPTYSYTESGTYHGRMSKDQRVYVVAAPAPFSGIPNFRIQVHFAVDYYSEGRPLPFTPPQVSASFQWRLFGSPFNRTESDLRPLYRGEGSPLQTRFPEQFDLFFDQSGPLQMRFELKDPDTNITRVYNDTIEIQVGPQPGTSKP